MKAISIFRYILVGALALPMHAIAQTPAVPSAPATSVPDASTNGAAGADTQGMKDKIFIHHVIVSGYNLIQYGQLAADTSTTPSIKKFGLRIVADHTELNDALKPVAEKMGVKIPYKLSKGELEQFEKLKALTGDAFDNQFVTMMVQTHRKDLDAYRTAAGDSNDEDVRKVADKGEAILYKNTKIILGIAAGRGISTVPEAAK